MELRADRDPRRLHAPRRGIGSPVALPPFLTLLFAAVHYPLRLTLFVGSVNLLAYFGAAAASGQAASPSTWYALAVMTIVAGIAASAACRSDAQMRQLHRSSRTAFVTGSLNRFGFDERLAAELSDARGSGDVVSLILLDLDDFKQLNDTQGHVAGDALLRTVSAEVAAAMRPIDTMGRIGGDEFAVLPGAEAAEAAAVADRTRARLEGTAAASAGVGTYPEDGAGPGDLLRAADLAMYADKGQRRRPLAA